jgi:putative hemolysin
MTTARRPFDLVDAQAPWPLRQLARAAMHWSGLARLQGEYESLAASLGDAAADPQCWLPAAERWLQVVLDLPAGDLDRVPTSGPTLVAAEHPTGAMEGILLLALLRRRRPDVKVLANRWLARIPALAGLVVPIDVYGHGNLGAVRAALRHLDAGGLLLAFPAGAVAWRRPGQRRAREAPWQQSFAALQRRSGAAVVPVHVAAENPGWFHAAGALHRHVRTVLLPRALLAQRGRSVALRVGHPIPPRQLERFGTDDRARGDYLRLRTGILARRVGERSPAPRPAPVQAPVAPPGRREALAAEIEALPPSTRLLAGNGLQVLCARATAIPRTLLEIGRLRELTFRQVGEGTGAARDLDRFDHTYHHLFVWDPAAREVVGAYRLGATDELLAQGGPAALYTSVFYDYAPTFWRRVSPALELGRSFVQPAYQRGFAPLLLLWRGIGAFVARQPRYRLLFGTVSISADHQPTSVALMVDHLQSHCLATELAPWVRSRRPWRPARRDRARPGWQPQQIADLQDVSAMVRELEVGRAGVPVLLEQYLKLGARLLGVNADPGFHTIDALVVVDLLSAPAHLQQRYLGAAGTAALQDHHAARAAPA